MAEGRSLFDLVALSDELEEALGVEVDVVTAGSLSPYLRDRILSEAVAL
jgi:predicted nucleotidyltransferase